MKIFYFIILVTPAFLAIAYCFKSWRKKVISLAEKKWNYHYGWLYIFSRVLLIYLLLFHFSSEILFSKTFELLPSTIVCVMIWKIDVVRNIFWFLRNKINLWAILLLAITCTLVPHFFFLGFTLAVLMVTSCYFSIGEEEMDKDTIDKKYGRES